MCVLCAVCSHRDIVFELWLLRILLVLVPRYRTLDMIFNINLSLMLVHMNVICFSLEHCDETKSQGTVICVVRGLYLTQHAFRYKTAQNKISHSFCSTNPLSVKNATKQKCKHTTARPFSNWLKTPIMASNTVTWRKATLLTATSIPDRRRSIKYFLLPPDRLNQLRYCRVNIADGWLGK